MINFSELSLQQIITVTFTLFAVIDMLGSTPVLISLKAKMDGQIRSLQATVASGALMILFLFLGKEFLGLLGLYQCDL
jgi:multiple antibiotic resistance protein